MIKKKRGIKLEEYKIRIQNAKQAIKNADYILIGAGAGLSTAAGLEYNGEGFQRDYKEFIEKYHFEDLYTASFYPFSSQEEKWAFWARLIKLNRFGEPLKLYQELLEFVKDKNYFVITTNVDGQFETAGFDKEKIFAVQGDYRFLQCENACHNQLYDNQEMVEEWLKHTKDCKIPSHLVPKCPVCGGNMEMNLRKDANFVQDENWYKQAKQYDQFLDEIKDKNVILLEMGVGFNTPGIIRFPFEQMTYQHLKTTLIRMNKDYPMVSQEIQNKTISFDEDIHQIIADVKEKSL